MVRILSCHHFRSQRIGRCDEAAGVAVAGDTSIVALEHQVNIYGRGEHHPCPGTHNISPEPGSTDVRKQLTPRNIQENHDIGTSFVFQKPFQPGSSPTNKAGTSLTGSADSIELNGDLRLSHSFSTVDAIDSMSYNDRGKYILCLEKRETSAHHFTKSVRAYFHWEKDHGMKPMRARIAGLVSPTGSEPEDDSLMMVEIPLTSPATTVASCNLTGHIACLSAESIINLFLFRAKEVTGRVKVHYYDFDRMYTVETPNFVPERVCFLSNYVACMNSQKVHVFRIKKEETNNSSPSEATVSSFSELLTVGRSNAPASPGLTKNSSETIDRVMFDPKNESVKVYLPSILKANRKRRSPNGLVGEEIQDEIKNSYTKLIFTAVHPGITVTDVLRVFIATTGVTTAGSQTSGKICNVYLFPLRMKDQLGGVALLVATPKEGFLYHLPSKPGCSVVRVTSYPFTAPLVSFAFDSLFFHALTETGLETYTTRSLFYAIRDAEGIKTFHNDCPFQEEDPSLVGIRPFVNVRGMACSNSCLSILACSIISSGKNAVKQLHEESPWTIYTLDLPDIDMVYDDIMRTSQLQSETNPEAYLSLLCEVHILLRLYIYSHPEAEVFVSQRYREISKLIGLAYLKSSWLNIASSGSGSVSEAPVTPSSNLPSMSSSPPSEILSTVYPSNISEDLVDKGVTYLSMGRCRVQDIFSPENSAWIREPRYVPGFVRLIEMTFLKSETAESNVENQKLSPTLASMVVEFLANNGPNILVDLVVRAPFIRECNTRRLLQILQQLTEAKDYSAKETLALLLTLVTMGGVDLVARTQVKGLLNKTNSNDLSAKLSKEIIFESRGQQTFLTDLAVCFASSDHQNLLTERVVLFLKTKEISISLVMLSFAQALNVNSDTELQHCITKCLTSILETYLSRKLLFGKMTDMTHVISDEEKRAIQLLVRTYLSNITSSGVHSPQSPVGTHQTSPNSHPPVTSQPNAEPHNLPASSPAPKPGGLTGPSTEATKQVSSNTDANATPAGILQRNQIFGNICTCVNFLFSVNNPAGMLTPQSQSIGNSPLFVSEESRENYIKLLSLLSSPVLANLEGVKEIVLTYLYKNAIQVKPTMNSTLYLILQVLSETPEKALNILLAKQPTTLMLFAKEMFGKTPSKWRILVTILKKKIQNSGSSNPAEADVCATILEGVYLHLANSLSPSELEQVLDKETEESNKFHGICKRVELANTYANMVITVSSDYLATK